MADCRVFSKSGNSPLKIGIRITFFSANPVGKIWDADTMAKIGGLCKKRDFIFRRENSSERAESIFWE